MNCRIAEEAYLAGGVAVVVLVESVFLAFFDFFDFLAGFVEALVSTFASAEAAGLVSSAALALKARANAARAAAIVRIIVELLESGPRRSRERLP
jgi:hypothetical protein